MLYVYSGRENSRAVVPKVMYTDANKVAVEDGRMYSRAMEEDKEEEDDDDDTDVWEDDEEEWEYEDESYVYLRSKFLESWLWTDVSLPNEPDRDG